MKKLLYFIMMTVLPFSIIYAEDNSGDNAGGDSTEYEKKFELKLSGNHDFKFKMPATDYITDSTGFKGNLAPKFKNDLGIDIYTKYVKFVSHWGIDLSVTNSTDIRDIISAKPLENYMSINAWKFKFGVGLQKFTWGLADSLNPTDNINPRDLTTQFTSNFTVENKMPVLSASVDFYPIDQLSLEAIYVPFYQKTKLPDMNLDSRISSYKANGYTGIYYKDTDFNFKDFTLGGKVNVFLTMIDFSFSYLYDVDPYYTPVITLENNNVIASGFTIGDIYRIKSIDLVHKRLHRFGTDFKVNINRFGFWGELCYTMSEDYLLNSYDIRNHSLSWTTGFDFTYGPNDDFRLDFQYAGTFIPGYDANFSKDYNLDDTSTLVNYNAIGNSLGKMDSHSKDFYEKLYYRALTEKMGNVNEGLVQMFSLNMSWPVLNSMLTPEISAIYAFPLVYDMNYETRYGGLFLEPKIDIQPIDDLHIIIGADLAYSWIKKHNESGVSFDDEWQYGRFRKENNIFIEVKYKWSFSLYK
jgi:hypothetical protein